MSPAPRVRAERRDGVLVLVIDNPPVNASSVAVRAGIIKGIDLLEVDRSLIGAVLIGAAETFVAGADIREFTGDVPMPILPTVIERIERCHKPVIAALDGVALGAGLELALGCDVRIATARCRLGLPEVTLGMIPGAGGTQRLPRLSGGAAAIEIIVSGRRIDGVEAKQLGIVDEIVDTADLLDIAIARAGAATKRVVADIEPPVCRDVDGQIGLLTDIAGEAVRGLPTDQVRESVRLVADAVCGRPVTDALADERATFTRFRQGPDAAALRHLFFAERAAGRVGAAAEATPVNRVAVIGAGAMGSGIAIALATNGIEAVLVDADSAAATGGRDRAAQAIARLAVTGRLDHHGAQSAQARLHACSYIGDIAGCQLVIEAVIEDLGVKQRVLADAEVVTGGAAILATNTSYLDVDEVAALVDAPGQVLGMHFFNPAHVMRLVEVVRGGSSTDQAVASAVRLVRRIGKQPIVVNSGEGFVGNRVFSAYRRHVEYLLEDGALPDQVDNALQRFGFAMGPFAVADLSGLQIAWAMRKRQCETGRRPARYVEIPDRLCELGRFGRRSGAGYYRYPELGSGPVVDQDVTDLVVAESARAGRTRRAIGDDEIVLGALLAMANEGALAVADGIASGVDDVDVAMVNGFGFPRSRGGPMWWTSRQPAERIELGLTMVSDAAGSSFRRADLASVLPAP